ncbi:MAG: methionine gamma-lyase family protein, partial [Candidatus Eremiobacteraeota bacterium]|nr:methionine gamma-lyase family protein [Candidatus Eremiobacteraeota bacterium]
MEAVLERLETNAAVADGARRAAWALAPRDLAVRARIRMSVIDAFRAEGITESDLAATWGYGYDDPARERYESLLARIFRAERALARLTLVSGTQAIVTTLAACASPGDTILSATGRPYDTLHHALVTAPHALTTRGIRYEEVPLAGGRVDGEALVARVRELRPRLLFVQRSRGYAPEPSRSVDDIGEIVKVAHSAATRPLVVVDNCYGEFVEAREPLEVGADAIVGSLIKNVGGSLAPTGAYVAGSSEIVERVAAYHYAPGLGDAVGPNLGFGRALVQGLFLAPLLVGEALRGLDFAAALFSELGYEVEPSAGGHRTDIVQAIALRERATVLRFAAALQAVLPVNARFAPVPGTVPGYTDQVVMSSGA